MPHFRFGECLEDDDADGGMIYRRFARRSASSPVKLSVDDMAFKAASAKAMTMPPAAGRILVGAQALYISYIAS